MLSQFQINFIKQVKKLHNFQHFPADWLEDTDAYAAWHAAETPKRAPIVVMYYTTDQTLHAYRVGVNRLLSKHVAPKETAQ